MNDWRKLDVTMYDLYLPLVQNPNPEAVIRVEKITGPILLISSKMDNMWPSEPAAKQIMKRLQENNFEYDYRHLSYDYWIPLRKPWSLFPNGEIGNLS